MDSFRPENLIKHHTMWFQLPRFDNSQPKPKNLFAIFELFVLYLCCSPSLQAMNTIILLLLLLTVSRTSNACTTLTPNSQPTLISGLEQVRISLGQFDKQSKTWSFVISFAAYKNNSYAIGPKQQRPSVLIGADNCVDVFYGTTTSYTYNVGPHLITVGFTKNLHYSSPWLYHVPVQGIAPHAKINYRVGLSKLSGDISNKDFQRTQLFTAYAPPAPGMFNIGNNEEEKIVRIAVIGDIGQTKHSESTRDSILADLDSTTSVSPSIAVIVGDMSYADGGAERWDSWGRMMEPLASRLPIMVLPGNHEIEMDNVTHEVFNHYRHRFVMPGTMPEISAPATDLDRYHEYGMTMRYDGGSSYYSFEVGPIHIICLNSYASSYPDDMQETFLKSDLMSVDRTVTPFIVVMMHAPWYNTNEGHQNEIATKLMRQWAEPLMVEHDVSIAFAGHVHAYERMAGMDVDGTPKSKGPMYVTIGDGGNHELIYDKWLPTPAYSLYKDSRFYGHGHLTAFNTTHFKWDWDPNPKNIVGVVRPDEDADHAWIMPYDLRQPLLASGLSGWAILFLVVVVLSIVVFVVAFFKGRMSTSGTDSEAKFVSLGMMGADKDELLEATGEGANYSAPVAVDGTFTRIDISVPTEETTEGGSNKSKGE